jgi:hypothetical protein
VTHVEFIFGPHIEHRCRTAAEAIEQFLPGHRIEFVAGVKIARHDARDLGAVALADTA